MIVKINGEEREFEPSVSVARLLEELGLRPGRVAVELNTEVVARDTYDSTHLKAGDELEIVHFVGGG